MSINRIQKLLYSEYSFLDDVVLIESPFAEISRKGLGIRQVHLGLTPTKFIIAADVLKDAHEYLTKFWPGQIDPEIETMELINVYPIEIVSLSVFQRRRRKILKFRIHNGDHRIVPKIAYYELGGFDNQMMFWNTWCEKVRFLSPTSQYNSTSEATVGSSTSNDSISPVVTKISGNRIWQYYGSKQNFESNRNLGLSTDLSNLSSCPIRTLFINKQLDALSTTSSPRLKGMKINRFGEGVDDQCGTDLFLPMGTYFKTLTNEAAPNKYTFKDFGEFSDQCVALWNQKEISCIPRSYAICLWPEFNRGLGLRQTGKVVKFYTQMRKTWSMISLVEDKDYHHKKSPNGKFLMESQSTTAVLQRSINLQQTASNKYLYFWTTNFRYIPDPIVKKYAGNKARSVKRSYLKKLQRTNIEEKMLKKLHTTLKMKSPVSVWSLDSDCLSSQLTTIDVNLFLKISTQELQMMKINGSGHNCKNFMTWLTFSHRISCLVATQIIQAVDTKSRARLVSRFIMVCDKCHRIGNQQSTESILHGLMSPAVYRLYATWDRIRRFHSTAYRVFKYLCRTTRASSTPDLTKPPFLPSALFLLDTLFGRVQQRAPVFSGKGSSEVSSSSLPAEESTLTKMMHHVWSSVTFSGKTSECSISTTFSSLDKGDLIVPSTQLSSSIELVESILRASQSAARMYDQTNKIEAQDFLLKQPYLEHSANFQLSLKVEPAVK